MGDVGCRVARVWEGTLMHPLESDFDPWRDTNEERGEERDNPLDSGSAESPFSADPEVVGIPNLVYGPQNRGPTHTSRPRLWRGILLLWLMVGLAGLLAGLSQVLT